MHPRPPSPIPTPVPPDLALRATRPPSQSARSRYSRIDHSRRGRRQPSGREFRRLAMPEWSLVAPAAPWHPYPLRYAQTLVSQPSARLCTRRPPCCSAALRGCLLHHVPKLALEAEPLTNDQCRSSCCMLHCCSLHCSQNVAKPAAAPGRRPQPKTCARESWGAHTCHFIKNHLANENGRWGWQPHLIDEG